MKIFKDMDDNQYWMTLWTFAFTIIMSLVGLMVYSSAAEDNLLEKMIDQGHDPIELSCLFNSGSESMKAPCLLIAQSKAKVILENGNVSE